MVIEHSRRPLLLALFAVSLAAALPFLPSLGNGFAEWWDDTQMLVENERFREITTASMRWMFSTFLLGHYQPLSWLSLAIDNSLWGLNPRGYHLTNLLLHAVNAALFAWLLLILPGAQAAGEVSSRRTRIAGAVAGALFFALHPLRTESVAWAIQRRDLLCAAYLLGSLLAYVSHARETGRRRLQLLLVSLGFYLLSLLSKATGIALGAVLLIMDIYPLRQFNGGAPEHKTVIRTRLVLAEKIPFLVLGAIFAIVAAAAQRETGATLTLGEHSLPARLMQASYGLLFYVWKTVFPIGLSPLYELPRPFPTGSPRFLVPLVALPIVVTALIVARRRIPWLLAAAGIYAAFLLPVLGLLQSGVQLVADRYTYVACLPWAALVGAGFGRAFSAAGPTASRAPRMLLVAAALLVAAGLGLLSWRQTGVWKDGFTLWSAVVQNDPRSALGHHYLGKSYLAHGQPEKAVQELRRSVELAPDSSDCLNDLGVALARLGRSQEAVDVYRRVLEANPDAAFVYRNLGQEYVKLKQREAAVAAFRRALELEPRSAEAHFSLGLALLAGGDLEGARHEQSELASIDRSRAEVLGQLIGRRSGAR